MIEKRLRKGQHFQQTEFEAFGKLGPYPDFHSNKNQEIKKESPIGSSDLYTRLLLNQVMIKMDFIGIQYQNRDKVANSSDLSPHCDIFFIRLYHTPWMDLSVASSPDVFYFEVKTNTH